MKVFSSSCGRRHRCLPIIAVLVAACFVFCASAPAQHSMPAGSSPYGQTYGEWSAEWWQWASSLQTDNHPLLDTGDCDVGQDGPVWFLGGTFDGAQTTRDCTVPVGKGIFFPIATTTYWAPEDLWDCPAPCADPEGHLRGVVNGIIDGATNVACTVDGNPVTPVRADSPAYTLPVPEGGVISDWGYPTGDRNPAVADGYYVMLPPLSVGSHTITLYGELWGGGFIQDVTYNLTVAHTETPIYGRTLGEWSAEWWQWASSLQTDNHPLLDTGDCDVGQRGHVWFLGGTFDGLPKVRTCTLPQGKAIFLAIVTTTYWAPEDLWDCPPPCDDPEGHLRNVVNGIIDGATNVACTVDGNPVTAVRVDSPAYTLPVPDGGVLSSWGYTPGDRDPAVADGYYVLLPPLPAGSHTITLYGELWGGGFVQDVTYNITVGH
jgi:hypothetical protein